ncbi:hypothetical protein [Streptomyces otsuchiensis]|uniref:hypothetical protein n=1 Tax=Streptomyces otsuchiensis TaxID=2681388 RepID=UPI00158207FF|nr:hypothetical protein [Streptomyces otsuchiensis]
MRRTAPRAGLLRRPRRGGAPPAGRAAVLLAAALTLPACSAADVTADGKPPPDAVTVIRGVPDALAGTTSSRATTSVRMASGGTRITIHGEGVFDYRRRVGELRVTLPEGPTEDRRAPVTELFTPGALYMKNRGAGVPPDKWVRVETHSLPDGNLVTGGATDPITATELLRGVLTAEYHGEVDLDGETVRLFSGVTDISAASRAAADEDRRRQLAAAVEAFTETAVPFDVYLDERGVPRKVRHRFSFGGVSREEATGVEVVSVTELYAFGVPVEIRMPEPGEIYSGTVVVDQAREDAEGAEGAEDARGAGDAAGGGGDAIRAAAG